MSLASTAAARRRDSTEEVANSRRKKNSKTSLLPIKTLSPAPTMNTAQDEFNALYGNQTQTLTTHPEDVSTASSSDHDSTTLRSPSFDDPTLASKPRPGMPSAAYHIPSTITCHANTGPKGVIADARAFDTAKKRSFRSTFQAFSANSSPPRLGKSKKSALDFSREKSASPDGSTDDDEDDFMRAWRVNRLAELASMSSSLRTRRHSPSPRKYGTLLAVDPAGYLDAVEKVSADTTVVVLIYDDEVCVFLPLPLRSEIKQLMVSFRSRPSAASLKTPCKTWPASTSRRALSNCTRSTPKWTTSPCPGCWRTGGGTVSPTWSASPASCRPVAT